MFKKVLQLLQPKKTESSNKQELKKAQVYYNLVKAGATFIQFIQEDLKRQENGMNRQQRRKFESELNRTGTLSPELVNYYKQKIDWVLMNIHQRLNPPKPPQSTPGMQVRQTPPPGVKVVELGKQESK